MKTRHKITRKDLIIATKDGTISYPLRTSIIHHTMYPTSSDKWDQSFIAHGINAYIIAGIHWTVTHVC